MTIPLLSNFYLLVLANMVIFLILSFWLLLLVDFLYCKLEFPLLHWFFLLFYSVWVHRLLSYSVVFKPLVMIYFAV